MKNLGILVAVSLLSGNVAFAKERYYHDDESHMKRLMLVDGPLAGVAALYTGLENANAGRLINKSNTYPYTYSLTNRSFSTHYYTQQLSNKSKLTRLISNKRHSLVDALKPRLKKSISLIDQAKRADRKVLRSIKRTKIGTIATLSSAALAIIDMSAFVALEIYENKVNSNRTKNLTGSPREEFAETKGSNAGNLF